MSFYLDAMQQQLCVIFCNNDVPASYGHLEVFKLVPYQNVTQGTAGPHHLLSSCLSSVLTQTGIFQILERSHLPL